MNTDTFRASHRTVQEIEDLIKGIVISHINIRKHVQIDDLYTAGFLDALEAIATAEGIVIKDFDRRTLLIS